MIAPLVSLSVLGAMALAAWGAGRPLARLLRLFADDTDRLVQAVWGLALGLVAWGTGLAVLGLCGLLYPALVQALTVAGAGAGVWQIARQVWTRHILPWRLRGLAPGEEHLTFHAPGVAVFLHRQWRRHGQSHAAQPHLVLPEHTDALTAHGLPPAAPDKPETCPDAVPGWFARGLWALVTLAVTGALCGALVPATAGDALCYHLELPRCFLAEHRLVYRELHDNATFPLLAEMWFAWGMAWHPTLADGGVAANLVHFALGLLLAGASVLLARPLLGRRWALVVGALVLLVPGVTSEMTAALNDVGMALFTTLALVAWRTALEEHSPRWFLAAGIAAGGALAIKYVALLFATAMGGLWLWNLLETTAGRGPRKLPAEGAPPASSVRLLVQGALCVTLGAACVAGLWYARAAWHRGNPVYPFFAETFGGMGQPVLRDSKRALGWNPLDLLAAPWHVTMSPEQFGGRGHQLGALFLALLPLLLATRRLPGLAWLGAFCGVYFVLWYALRQNVRFLFPVIPLLAVVAAWVLGELRRFPARPRYVIHASVALLIGFQALLPWHRAADGMAAALGGESRENYLRRRECSYVAAEAARQFLPAHAHVLTQDFRLYYYPCRMTREVTYRRASNYHKQLDPGGLAERLRGDGFTHVLLVEPAGTAPPQTLGRLVREALQSQPCTLCCLWEHLTTDGDGTVKRYALYELRPQER